MKQLIIETSTERGIVAILDDEKILFKKELPFGQNNSKFIIPIIDQAFKESNIYPKDLNFITVGIGPGSYTGIRVGVIVAKTMAFSCQIPVIGVSSLESFPGVGEGEFAVLIDAKIGGCYFLKAQKEGGGIHHIGQPEICELSILNEKISDVNYVVTPNFQQLRPKVEKIFPELNLEWVEVYPDPLQMGLIGKKRFLSGDGNKKLEILYLRKTQAEIEKGY